MMKCTFLIVALALLATVHAQNFTQPDACSGFQGACCDKDPLFDAQLQRCFKLRSDYPNNAALRAACVSDTTCTMCVVNGTPFCGPKRTEATACSERNGDTITKFGAVCQSTDLQSNPGPCDGIGNDGTCCDKKADFNQAATDCYDLFTQEDPTQLSAFQQACAAKNGGGKCTSCQQGSVNVCGPLMSVACDERNDNYITTWGPVQCNVKYVTTPGSACDKLDPQATCCENIDGYDDLVTKCYGMVDPIDPSSDTLDKVTATCQKIPGCAMCGNTCVPDMSANPCQLREDDKLITYSATCTSRFISNKGDLCDGLSLPCCDKNSEFEQQMTKCFDIALPKADGTLPTRDDQYNACKLKPNCAWCEVGDAHFCGPTTNSPCQQNVGDGAIITYGPGQCKLDNEHGPCEGFSGKCCDDDENFDAEMNECFNLGSLASGGGFNTVKLRAQCAKNPKCTMCVQDGTPFCAPVRSKADQCSERVDQSITTYGPTCSSVQLAEEIGPCDGVMNGACCDKEKDFAAHYKGCFAMYYDLPGISVSLDKFKSDCAANALGCEFCDQDGVKICGPKRNVACDERNDNRITTWGPVQCTVRYVSTPGGACDGLDPNMQCCEDNDVFSTLVDQCYLIVDPADPASATLDLVTAACTKIGTQCGMCGNTCAPLQASTCQLREDNNIITYGPKTCTSKPFVTKGGPCDGVSGACCDNVEGFSQKLSVCFDISLGKDMTKEGALETACNAQHGCYFCKAGGAAFCAPVMENPCQENTGDAIITYGNSFCKTDNSHGPCDGVKGQCCDKDVPSFDAKMATCFQLTPFKADGTPDYVALRANCLKLNSPSPQCTMCVQDGTPFCAPIMSAAETCSERVDQSITTYGPTCSSIQLAEEVGPCDGVANGACCDKEADFGAQFKACFALKLPDNVDGMTTAQFASKCSSNPFDCVSCMQGPDLICGPRRDVSCDERNDNYITTWGPVTCSSKYVNFPGGACDGVDPNVGCCDSLPTFDDEMVFCGAITPSDDASAKKNVDFCNANADRCTLCNISGTQFCVPKMAQPCQERNDDMIVTYGAVCSATKYVAKGSACDGVSGDCCDKEADFIIQEAACFQISMAGINDEAKIQAACEANPAKCSFCKVGDTHFCAPKRDAPCQQNTGSGIITYSNECKLDTAHGPCEGFTGKCCDDNPSWDALATECFNLGTMDGSVGSAAARAKCVSNPKCTPCVQDGLPFCAPIMSAAETCSERVDQSITTYGPTCSSVQLAEEIGPCDGVEKGTCCDTTDGFNSHYKACFAIFLPGVPGARTLAEFQSACAANPFDCQYCQQGSNHICGPRMDVACDERNDNRITTWGIKQCDVKYVRTPGSACDLADSGATCCENINGFDDKVTQCYQLADNENDLAKVTAACNANAGCVMCGSQCVPDMSDTPCQLRDDDMVTSYGVKDANGKNSGQCTSTPYVEVGGPCDGVTGVCCDREPDFANQMAQCFNLVLPGMDAAAVKAACESHDNCGMCTGLDSEFCAPRRFSSCQENVGGLDADGKTIIKIVTYGKNSCYAGAQIITDEAAPSKSNEKLVLIVIGAAVGVVLLLGIVIIRRQRQLSAEYRQSMIMLDEYTLQP